MKKILALALSGVMILCSTITSHGKENTSFVKDLKVGKTYKYDIDGDGDKDKIRLTQRKGTLYLKVNSSASKKLGSSVHGYWNHDLVSIYNFNKKDKTMTIVYESCVHNSNLVTKLLKFRNNTCKLEKTFKGIIMNDSTNGYIEINDYNPTFYKCLEKAFRCNTSAPMRIFKIKDYTLTNTNTANIVDYSADEYYKTTTKMNAYTTSTGNKKAFTIKKNNKVQPKVLYIKGNNKRIKVKTSNGKTGWIKFEGKRLFTDIMK